MEQPPCILYLWHVARPNGILQTIWQQFTADNIIDGNTAPSAATLQKLKTLSDEPETHKKLGTDIHHMTHFI